MVEMTLERALELYQVREALEGLAARLAALYANEKILDKMGEILENQIKVVEKGDLLGYSRTDFDFHGLIHKMSHNAVLQEMLESLKTKMQPITVEVRPILPRLYEDHLEIIERHPIKRSGEEREGPSPPQSGRSNSDPEGDRTVGREVREGPITREDTNRFRIQNQEETVFHSFKFEIYSKKEGG